MSNTIYYTIYQTINLVNNKIYIGQHETVNPNDSYLGSGKILKQAIQKYGSKNFKKEVLFIYDNFNEMNDKETEIVNEEFISRIDTYNIVIGGGHHNDTFTHHPNKERIRQNFIEGTNNYYKTPSGEKTKEKISKSLKIFYSSSKGEELRKIKSEKTSQYFASDKSKEQKKKLSLVHSGKKRTPEERKKQSDTIKKLGLKTQFYERMNTPEARLKSAKNRKGKGLKKLNLIFKDITLQYQGIDKFCNEYFISKYYFGKLLKGIPIKQIPNLLKIEII